MRMRQKTFQSVDVWINRLMLLTAEYEVVRLLTSDLVVVVSVHQNRISSWLRIKALTELKANTQWRRTSHCCTLFSMSEHTRCIREISDQLFLLDWNSPAPVHPLHLLLMKSVCVVLQHYCANVNVQTSLTQHKDSKQYDLLSWPMIRYLYTKMIYINST